MLWRRLMIVGVALAACGGVGYFGRAQFTSARRLAAWSEQQQNESIREGLKKPVDLGVEMLTLRDFAARFGERTGVDVVIEEDALKLVGVSPTQPVPVKVLRSDVAAESQLTLALQQLELCWIVKGGQIIITTPERAQALQFVVATYVLPQGGADDTAVDAQQWAAVITSVIRPDAWDNVGGRGHCAVAGGALVIAHRPEVHRQIRALFDGLQAAGNPPASWQPVPLGPSRANGADAAVLARLQRPASVDCRELPLDDFVKFLEQEHDLPLVISQKKLEEASVSPDTPLTINVSGVTLQSLLNQVLKELELVVIVRDGVAQITTPEDAESQLVLVGYPVHDLVTVPGGSDYDSLLNLVIATIKPDSWDDVGGPASLEAINGWLLIPQTLEVHEQLESLLSELRRQLALGPATNVFANRERHAAEARIAVALQRPTRATYYGCRLKHVCDDLRSQLGVTVRINLKRLEEASVSPDTPITCDFPIAPAHVQLRRLLEPLELTFVIRDEALVITTPEDAESHLTTRVYDVRPLLDNDVGLFRTNGLTHDADSLIEMITGLIKPDSWDDVGGPGAIEVFRGLLVTSQTEAVHDDISAFLSELRRAMAWGNQPGVMPTTEPTSAEKAILTALEREISLEYNETPLSAVAHDLSKQLGTVVHLQTKKLAEASISSQTPLTGRFPAAPARVQLARLCEPLELTFEVHDDLLQITTPEDAEAHLQTRIYDVRALMAPASGSRSSGSLESHGILDVIAKHVHPDSWDNVGGPGSIDAVQGVLVVSHTAEVHREVAALLAALHALRQTKLPGEPEWTCAIWTMPDEVEQRIYERLAEPVDINVTEMPLDQALETLSQRSGVPIRLDRRDLEGAGISPDAPYSVNERGLTLAGVLDRLLPDDVQYSIRNRELLVTLAARCESHLRSRLYRMDDLLLPGEANSDLLCEQIIAKVQPDRWDDVGGSCSISVVQGGWLLVTADTVTQEHLDDWLRQQRTGTLTQRAKERAEFERRRSGAGFQPAK